MHREMQGDFEARVADPDPYLFIRSDPDPYLEKVRIRIHFWKKIRSGSIFVIRLDPDRFLECGLIRIHIWKKVESSSYLDKVR